MEKRTLNRFKKNLEKPDIVKFPITGLSIISMIIENQNLLLLKKIADKKFSTQEEKDNFIEEFHKISYHIPELASKNQENYQKELQKFIK